MLKAIVSGAVAAVALGLLLAAGYGGLFGAREPWGDVQVGVAGARTGVNNLLFPPILLAVVVIGALLGAAVRYVRQGHANLRAGDGR